MSSRDDDRKLRLLSTIETICSSLTFRCAICMIAYAAVLIGLFSFVGMLVEKKLSEAFPTVDTLLEHEDALANDQFCELRNILPSNSDALVFSRDGERLFSTSDMATETVTAADLPIISSDDGVRRFYEVLEREDGDGNPLYEVLLCSADEASRTKIVVNSCTCRTDGTIVSGDLFADRTSLSKRELSLIRGVCDARRTIQKHEYETTAGEPRTLVVMAPIISESAYNAIVAQAGQIRLFAIPFALVATIVAVTVLALMVRRMAYPLDQAIDARRESPGAKDLSRPLPIELRPTYENFIVLMDQLDNAREDKQRVIANISHDLKTPLTVIRGYTQAFVEGRVPKEKSGQYLWAMHSRATTATELIDQLIAYAKCEHPAFSASPTTCDLYEQLRLLLVRWQPDLERGGCTLEAAIPDGSVITRLDWNLMERAIDNLVGNAYRHNPPGTTIRVSCTRVGKEVVISIADTGVGISEELRSAAFKPFVTTNAARASGKGTGLGLSIASSFVRLNGGTIEFSENVSKPFRTEVLIFLPIDDA